jgi:hypothetical protein
MSPNSSPAFDSTFIPIKWVANRFRTSDDNSFSDRLQPASRPKATQTRQPWLKARIRILPRALSPPESVRTEKKFIPDYRRLRDHRQ